MNEWKVNEGVRQSVVEWLQNKHKTLNELYLWGKKKKKLPLLN